MLSTREHVPIVIVREDEPEQKRLVAYMVPTYSIDSEKETANFIEELRQLLNKYLPEYMIPSAFKLLEQLPLNLNGKIDRKALPKPEEHYRISEIVLPRNILEKELLTIWSEFLTVEASKISTTDNFFHIGGNSLLLFQVLNRINHSTSLKISVLDIYQNPTINKLATFMTSQVMSNKNYSLLPIRTGGARNLFLVHAGATTVLPYLHFANLEGWSVYGINNPYFGQEQGFKSIAEMAACYLDQIKEIRDSQSAI